MGNNKGNEVIDFKEIFSRLWKHRVVFYKVLPVVFVLSCIYILSIPRTYTSQVKLAPETESGFSQGGLGSLAASFGFDIGSMATSDAIFPELYPELLGTNDFVTKLFNITVEKEDGTLRTDYYTYLTKHQKHAWWMPVVYAVKSVIPKSEQKRGDGGDGGDGGGFNPLYLSEQQSMTADLIKSRIRCNIDRKTSLITIDVKDQDPLISATLADSIRLKIQEFIIDYRTRKARIDMNYYKQLTEQSKADYDEARLAFTRFADSNRNVVLESMLSRQKDLENDMQMKYTNYTTYNAQLQMAIAKLQERTPSFTLLQGASVPIKASGPKRMRFVFAMMFLAVLATSGYILAKK